MAEQSQADTEMLPAEADDRSRTGGRCDDRRPCVNSVAHSAAEQQVDKPGEGGEVQYHTSFTNLCSQRTNEFWQVNLIKEEGQVGLCTN